MTPQDHSPCLQAVYLCDPLWENPLCDELYRANPESKPVVPQPGWVEDNVAATGGHLAFARQLLPQPIPVAANSVNAWAKAAIDIAGQALQLHGGCWRLHVVSVPIPGGNAGPRRCQLVRKALLELLRRKQRRLLRALTVKDDTPWREDEAVLQVALQTATAGYVSLALPDERFAMRRVLSRFAGGIVEVPADARAPSQADRKLREVELRLGRPIQPGECCVDLGASPGGWSYVALQRGAQVIAVDRALLRADLMSNPDLSFVRRDAFRYQPEQAVDWLLCDVIAFPHRIVSLLSRWLQRGWCRNFCVTVKFRGREDYAQLEPLKQILAVHATETCIRRLTANKNEVTANGAAGDRALPSTAC